MVEIQVAEEDSGIRAAALYRFFSMDVIGGNQQASSFHGEGHGLADKRGVVLVVGIQQADIAAACEPDAFVHRGIYAEVRFGDEIVDPVRVFPDDFQSGFVTSAIDNDGLHVGVVL
nr:hypothetical protein [Luteolibacter yonseiensis]